MDINLLANTFEENEGGDINLIFVFLVLNFTFFYCMMWNKLLLTEFVIYLCCLVGLMLLVFEFYRFFFFPFEIFPCFVMSAGVHTSWLFGKGWLMTNLAYFDDLIMSRKKNDSEKRGFQSRCCHYTSSQPQMQLIKYILWSVPAFLLF